MNDWMNYDNRQIAVNLAEDAGAPELRNPLNYNPLGESWFRKIVRTLRG